MIRHLAIGVLIFLLQSVAHSQTQESLSVPADSPRWALQGEARVADYQGRKFFFLDGGAAVLNDFEMRDGVIDVDVATPARRGFFGVDVRIDEKGSNYEEIYLRQHKSGLPDAMRRLGNLNDARHAGG